MVDDEIQPCSDLNLLPSGVHVILGCLHVCRTNALLCWTANGDKALDKEFERAVALNALAGYKLHCRMTLALML